MLQDGWRVPEGQAKGWGAKGLRVKIGGEWSTQQTERNLAIFWALALKAPQNH